MLFIPGVFAPSTLRGRAGVGTESELPYANKLLKWFYNGKNNSSN